MYKCLYLMVGKSGSGKTSLYRDLKDLLGMKCVDSYTSRAPRYDGEDGHIFISKEDFEAIDTPIAFVEYGGNFYCTDLKTLEQAELYIVEPSGIDEVRNVLSGKREFRVIYIDVSDEVAEERRIARGDDSKLVEDRQVADDAAFANFIMERADLVVVNNDRSTSLSSIIKFIGEVEALLN